MILNNISLQIRIEKLSSNTLLCDNSSLRKAYEMVLNGENLANPHTVIGKLTTKPIWRGKIGKSGKWVVASSLEEVVERLENQKLES